MTPRNIRLHSDYVLFILDYHKAQVRTHASRTLVRYLYPAVAQLLIQYLILVQPFCTFLAQETEIPRQIGEYLFSSDVQPWPEERFTRILTRVRRQSIGRAVNTHAWRQLCIAIAIKQFSGRQYEADVDLPGNEDDELAVESMRIDGVTLPTSFHAQATHSTHTGNRAYALFLLRF